MNKIEQAIAIATLIEIREIASVRASPMSFKVFEKATTALREIGELPAKALPTR